MFLLLGNFLDFLLSLLLLIVTLCALMRAKLCYCLVCDKLFTAILTDLLNLNHAAHKNVFKNIVSVYFSFNFA